MATEERAMQKAVPPVDSSELGPIYDFMEGMAHKPRDLLSDGIRVVSDSVSMGLLSEKEADLLLRQMIAAWVSRQIQDMVWHNLSHLSFSRRSRYRSKDSYSKALLSSSLAR